MIELSVFQEIGICGAEYKIRRTAVFNPGQFFPNRIMEEIPGDGGVWEQAMDYDLQEGNRFIQNEVAAAMDWNLIQRVAVRIEIGVASSNGTEAQCLATIFKKLLPHLGCFPSGKGMVSVEIEVDGSPESIEGKAVDTGIDDSGKYLIGKAPV